MKQENWVYYYIAVHPNKKELDEDGRWKVNHFHSHLIKGWRYPQWIVRRHSRFFNWVLALVQVRFPQHYVTSHYCAYLPDTKERLTSKRRMNISSAKAQVTRYQNKIELLKQHCAGTLFQDYTQHPVYPKLKSKLEEKKFKLNQAVMAEIEETV